MEKNNNLRHSSNKDNTDITNTNITNKNSANNNSTNNNIINNNNTNINENAKANSFNLIKIVLSVFIGGFLLINLMRTAIFFLEFPL